MANRLNSASKIRADIKKREHNKNTLSEIRTCRRKFLEAVAAKNKAGAGDLFKVLASKIDRGVKRNVLKDNAASRLKSRAASKLRLIQA